LVAGLGPATALMEEAIDVIISSIFGADAMASDPVIRRYAEAPGMHAGMQTHVEMASGKSARPVHKRPVDANEAKALETGKIAEGFRPGVREW
jgi:hypothetical protein